MVGYLKSINIKTNRFAPNYTVAGKSAVSRLINIYTRLIALNSFKALNQNNLPRVGKVKRETQLTSGNRWL